MSKLVSSHGLPWLLLAAASIRSGTVLAAASAAAAPPAASTLTATPSPTATAAQPKHDRNMVVALAVYLKDSVTRTIRGCGELWTNHGTCNDIRSKIKAHRQTIKAAWEEQGYYDSSNSRFEAKDLNQQLEQVTAGISYEEFAFLQKGKEDRGKVLNLLFFVFAAPRFLPYALMFNGDMLPSPLQPPPRVGSAESVWERLARQRSAEIIETLLRLEKDACEIPALAKLNIFGRKQQEQTLKDNQLFNQQAVHFLAHHMENTAGNYKTGAQQLLQKLHSYVVSPSQDFTRAEKRLCEVPPSIVKGLNYALSGGKGALASLTPHALNRGKLLSHLQKVEEADRFLVQSQINVTTLSPKLLRDACSDRLIGGPAYTLTELQQSLQEWLQLVSRQEPPAASTATLTALSESNEDSVPVPEAAANSVLTASAAPTQPQPVDTASSVFYNENVARVALLSYYGMQGTRDSRNRQSAMPRLLFASPPSARPADGPGNSKKKKPRNRSRR